MGTWGTQPFENDAALDLKSEWDEAKDVNVLEGALDRVMELDVDDYLDVIDAEAAIGAIAIILGEDVGLAFDYKARLLQMSAGVLGRVLENSEVQELWSETESYADWLSSITNLMQQIVEQLQNEK